MSRRGRNKSKFSLFAFQDIITSVTGIMVLVTLVLALELIQRKESSAQERSKQIIDQVAEVTGSIEHIQKDIEQTQQEIERLRQVLARKRQDAIDLATHDVERIRQRVGDLRRIQTDLERELEELARQLAKIRESNEDAKHTNATVSPAQIERLEQQLADTRDQLERIKKSKGPIYAPNPGESRSPWLIQISANKIMVAQVGKSARPSEFGNLAAFAGWLRGQSHRSDYFMLLVKPDGVKLFDQLRKLLKQQRFDVGYDVLSEKESAIDPQRGAGL